VGSTDELLGVSMLNSDIAMTVGRGGSALRTSDGGLTWMPAQGGLSGYDLHDVAMLDEATAVALGYASQSAVLRTTDAGASWTEQQADIEIHEEASLAFASRTRGYIVAFEYAHIHTTGDGGRTWERLEIPTFEAHAVAAIDEDNVVLVGRLGTILQTTTGGR
jgi:photosystem II stability/assembly factor-like uncharacterized protein